MLLSNRVERSFPEPEIESDLTNDYPDEVLEAEWNPILAEIQLLKTREKTESSAEIEDSPSA